ncbi:3-deoxy-manno-octulosonate cytidylyltransferase [Gemmatimonas groenlandica]|uniref:3-deoxy-manno-octulosonate cytidylyltransferase n=1 Tax=Gemmatimonas groenlandica TaxID=2732249 RepID=A0A6M4INR5_9BACT|nr:3-deoxy-manno-octulosonate cytidylyltransferase [Gemmatimonas groenlandica]QJR35076.1 3-deoxy-manno-octulosonate cytidylyltransferase [Gemmatimonas groenlandica]
MSVLAVIPARLGATRLPRKPLRLLAGEPLIVRVFERVAALAVADQIIVATDHPEVLAACESRGIPVVMTRDDHPSGTDRVAEVAARPEFAQFTVVLNVQGDEPFVSRAALAGAVSIVTDGRAPIGTAAVPIPVSSISKPDIVKVVRGDDGLALYFSRAPIPYLRDPADAGAQQALARQHVGVYAYTREALRSWVGWAPHPLELVERLEQLRPLAHGLAIGVADVPAAEGGIDTEDDLERANLRWHAFQTDTLS